LEGESVPGCGFGPLLSLFPKQQLAPCCRRAPFFRASRFHCDPDSNGSWLFLALPLSLLGDENRVSSPSALLPFFFPFRSGLSRPFGSSFSGVPSCFYPPFYGVFLASAVEAPAACAFPLTRPRRCSVERCLCISPRFSFFTQAEVPHTPFFPEVPLFMFPWTPVPRCSAGAFSLYPAPPSQSCCPSTAVDALLRAMWRRCFLHCFPPTDLLAIVYSGSDPTTTLQGVSRY